jgi:hypothetical protein
MNNDKLNELAIKAGLISVEDGKFTRTYLNYEEKKFAELIVQECIGIAHDHQFTQSHPSRITGCRGAGMVAYKISRQFGVEE